jgi:hypothetical protein
MRQFLTILLIVGFVYFIRSMVREYKTYEKKDNVETQTRSPAALPGMPESLETTLETAKRQGAPSLKAFIRDYRIHLRDPRLADIELDYVVLVSRNDPAEAKAVFKAVQQRTSQSSPVYPRIQKLENTYR